MMILGCSLAAALPSRGMIRSIGATADLALTSRIAASALSFRPDPTALSPGAGEDIHA